MKKVGCWVEFGFFVAIEVPPGERIPQLVLPADLIRIWRLWKLCDANFAVFVLQFPVKIVVSENEPVAAEEDFAE